jgi:hypothetical protein
MATSNIFLDEFMKKKTYENQQFLTTNNNYVRLSENIIDINPVPIFVKTTITNDIEINNEFNMIAAGLKEEELYINKNQDPNTDFGFFTSQNAYVPSNNILNNDNIHFNTLKQQILSGIAELLYTIYNYTRDFKFTILNSWIQKYKSGTFLSPHNHLTTGSPGKVFSVAYYIDDGDPDVTQTYSGCISFISNNSLFHFRPKSGSLLIWEDHLIHLVNPFFSKSGKERFMLSTNISVELDN